MCSGEGAGRGNWKKHLKSRLISFLSSNKPVSQDNSHNSVPSNNGWFEEFHTNRNLLKGVAKASRINCSKALCKVLKNVIKENDKKSWIALFSFKCCCLSNPYRGGRKNNSLATVVNKKIIKFEKGDLEKVNLSNSKTPSNPPSLASLVAAKISVGDVKGAVRLASSDDSVLNPSQEIKSKLELKHPNLQKILKFLPSTHCLV